MKKIISLISFFLALMQQHQTVCLSHSPIPFENLSCSTLKKTVVDVFKGKQDLNRLLQQWKGEKRSKEAELLRTLIQQTYYWYNEAIKTGIRPSDELYNVSADKAIMRTFQRAFNNKQYELVRFLIPCTEINAMRWGNDVNDMRDTRLPLLKSVESANFVLFEILLPYANNEHLRTVNERNESIIDIVANKIFEQIGEIYEWFSSQLIPDREELCTGFIDVASKQMSEYIHAYNLLKEKGIDYKNEPGLAKSIKDYLTDLEKFKKECGEFKVK